MNDIYSKVEAIFWEDTRRWPEDERILLLYYMTTRHRNLIGLFLMPECYALHHLGWKSDRYQKALKGLIQREKVSFDPNVDLILVHNHLKHNPLDNPNKVKGAADVLKELPNTFLMVTLGDLVDKFKKSDVNTLLGYINNRVIHISTVSEPLPNPSEISNSNSNSNSRSNSNSKEKTETPPADIPPKSNASITTDINMLVDEWNGIVVDKLPKVEAITKKRTEIVKSLFKKGYSVKRLIEAFTMAAASDFLCGDNDRKWSCSFDWVLNETNLVKILEGVYANKKQAGNPVAAAMASIPQMAPDPNCSKCGGEGHQKFQVDGIANAVEVKCTCWKEVPEWVLEFKKRGNKGENN